MLTQNCYWQLSILPANIILLYECLKIWVRLSAWIFCNKIIVNKRALLKSDGPLLIAANHPNSFLDAILLDILFKQPIWSLARGDVFRKPFYIKLLNRLKILPVYRTREGVENLEENYKTFEACRKLFRHNGIVLIFSEGLCINEWHLRPLKKGTARLALSAWQEGVPLKVLPAGINYSSFSRSGKNVFINFGEIIEPGSFNLNDTDGKNNLLFNQLLEAQLRELVFEIPQNDIALQAQKFETPAPAYVKALLLLPAIAGLLLNAPFYMLIRWYVRKRVKHTDHFDSVMLALLTFTYPIYLLLLAGLALAVKGPWFMAITLIGLPLSAKAYIRIKSKTGRQLKRGYKN